MKYVKNKTVYNENVCKQYRSMINVIMKILERDHYDQLFKENVNNLTKSWSIIKDIINKMKVLSHTSKLLILYKCWTYPSS